MKPTQFEGFLFFSSFLFLVECFHINFRRLTRFIATRQNIGNLSSFIFLSLALAFNMLYSRCVVETVFCLLSLLAVVLVTWWSVLTFLSWRPLASTILSMHSMKTGWIWHTPFWLLCSLCHKNTMYFAEYTILTSRDLKPSVFGIFL